jgi:aspartate aminotransferase-like enzyme
MINHRGPEFAAVMDDVISGLRWALRTENDVLLYPCSGTGGLEATVVNLLSPGEQALFCAMGSFGERWAKIGEIYGAEVVRLTVPQGEPIDPEDVERTLAEHPEITTVFVTHNETSTGVTNDLAAIAGVVKSRGKMLAVDSVSGAGCLPLNTDELGIDVLVTGSQKGWMAPPGIAMIAVSAAAFARSETATCPRFYLDFGREKKSQDKNQTATTPAVSVMFALQEGLAMLREEGIENVWARHHRVGNMIRAGVEAMGMKLLAAEGHRSDTVTAVHSPADSPDALKELLTTLRTKHGLVLAGGQESLQGKIFRIGHLGFIDDADAYTILSLLEAGLIDTGLRTRGGLAVGAAQAEARGAVAQAEPVTVG